MGTPKFTDPCSDLSSTDLGLVVGYICMFGFSDDTGDHVLRVEASASSPSARLVLGFKAWDLVGELYGADPSTLVVPFCASHNVKKLQFYPEMLPMSEASTGTCSACGALNCRLPWRRDAALW